MAAPTHERNQSPGQLGGVPLGQALKPSIVEQRQPFIHDRQAQKEEKALDPPEPLLVLHVPRATGPSANAIDQAPRPS